MASVKENLIAAKALIDTPAKWVRGDYRDTVTGCMCAIGSVARAMELSPGKVEASTFEGKALALALPEGWERDTVAIVEFNDDPTTTHADVMAMFDRAIAAQGDRP